MSPFFKLNQSNTSGYEVAKLSAVSAAYAIVCQAQRMALGCGNGDSEVAGFAIHFRAFHAVQSLYLRSQFRQGLFRGAGRTVGPRASEGSEKGLTALIYSLKI